MDRSLLPPKAFYLVYFLAMAFFGPFLPLYYREIGMTGQEIGLLGSVRPLVVLLGGPLWGALADATRRHRWMLTFTLSSALVFIPSLFLTRDVLILGILVVLGAFLRAPAMPLIDSTVLRILGDRRDLYGRQRLWGTIGYSAGVLCVGVLTQRAGLRAVVYGFLPLMLATILISFRLPVTGYRRRIPFWRGVRRLVSDRRWAIFLIAIFIAGLGRSGGHRFLVIHMSDLGMPRSLMGLGIAVGALGEIPLFFYSSVVLRRWSTRTLLIFSWLVSIARLFALSVMRSPWLFLPLQLAQGIAFSATFSAGINLTSEMAPEGMGATAQALYGAMRGGLASAVGAFLAGMVYDRWGGAVLFRGCGLAIAAALLFFTVAYRRMRS